MKSIELISLYSAPSSWWEHVPIAHWLIEKIKPKKVVELGTHYGVSFFSFCEAAQKFSPDTFIYAVDTWQGDDQAGFYSENVYEEVKKHHHENHKQISRMVKSTFDDALNMFEDKSIDLLHIDGLHTYDAVKHDFISWLPKIAYGGTILFHDWNVRERDFGVWKLWGEIKENDKFKCMEVANGHGLGIATLIREKPGWHTELQEDICLLKMKGYLLEKINYLREKERENIGSINTLEVEIELLKEEVERQKQHSSELTKIVERNKDGLMGRIWRKLKRA